jgi:hypothetical protein
MAFLISTVQYLHLGSAYPLPSTSGYIYEPIVVKAACGVRVTYDLGLARRGKVRRGVVTQPSIIVELIGGERMIS